MSKKLVVVTGKDGQLGWELARLSSDYSETFGFLFTGRADLDLADPRSIDAFFGNNRPDYFVHCAAYTLVDKAESEKELSAAINATASGLLASHCAKIGCPFILVSTDYVFDGNGTSPYEPDRPTSPVNHYGATKRDGENLALKANPQTIVVRTSWVYSQHGNNFVKTMLRLMKERPALNIVADQTGSPTWAADLASGLMNIVARLSNGTAIAGVFHYSNSGVTTWFAFAEKIKSLAGLSCELTPIPTSAYPTPAKRPAYSVMSLQKTIDLLGTEPPQWEKSLATCIKELQA